MAKVYNLTDVAFQARQGSAYANGDIFKANVYVGMTQDNMALVGTYSFDRNGYFLANREEFKHMAMNAVGQFVKVEAVETGGDGGQLNVFASMGEIRFYGTEYVEPEVVDKAALVRAITDAQAAYGEEETYTVDSFATFKAAYEAAIVVYENADATQVAVNNAATALVNAKAALVVKPRELTDLINKEANAVTVESYSSQCGGAGEPSESGGGQASKTVDYNEDTYWHSNYNTSNGQKHTITYNLGKEYTLKDVTFLPRKGGRNGDIHKFEVYVGNSTDYTQNTLTGEYVFATSGTLTEGQWYRADVFANGEFIGQYVTIRITGSYGDSGNDQFASMGEIRFYGTEYVAPVVVDKTALNAAIASAKVIVDAGNDAGTYTEGSWEALSQAYAQAQVVAENDEATQEEVDEAKEQLEAAVENLTIAPADYSAVNAAIEVARALDANLYTNFDAVTAAINAVVEGKDITKQAEVDAMAKAINDAVAALTYKGADYSAVNAAIEAANALDANLYTNFDAVTTAINAVVEGKDITKQAEVDGYAAAILAAIENLVPVPSQSTTLVATATNYKTITLTWNAVEGASYYEVYRQNTKTGLWIKLADATTNTYVVNGVKTGKEYTYKVIAMQTLDEGTSVIIESNEAKGKAMLTGAPTLSATMEGSSRFVLNWTQVEGATRYIIYRKAENGTYKKILTLGADATTYTSNSMMPGTYFYVVKAARYDGSERMMSEASNEVEVQSTASTSQLEVVENATGAQLTWTAIEGMKYYEVYVSAANQDAYRRVKVQSTTTYNTQSLKAGVTYNFKVRGYRINNDAKVYSAYSNVVTYTAK